MRMRTGGFYRRRKVKVEVDGHVVWKDSHIPVEESETGTIYYRYQVDKKRKSFCTGTEDAAIARERVAKFLGVIAYSDREQYLRSLAELGEQAAQELNQVRHAQRRIPLKAVWDEYLASKRRPDSGAQTMRGYRAQWRRFEKWANKPGVEFLHQITPAAAEGYITDLEQAGFKRGTINQHVNLLRLVFRVLNTGYDNPFEGLHSTAKAPESVPYRRLTVEEVRAIVKAAAGEWRTLCLVGYHTGLRIGDAATLQWDHVDLKRMMIRQLKLQKTKDTSGVVVDIPIVGGLERELKRLDKLRSNKASGGPIMPYIADRFAKDSTKVSGKVSAIFAAAGVGDTEKGRASFHSFRSTFQSLNDDAGTSRVHIRGILGHASSAMSDSYSQLEVERARKSVATALPKVG